MPIRLSDGLAGVLLTWRSDTNRAGLPQIDLLQMFAEQVSVALTGAATVAKMNAALHDGLTGLASRALFLDRLHHAMTLARTHEEPLSLWFIDLDRFKQVNDALGRAAGGRGGHRRGADLGGSQRAHDDRRPPGDGRCEYRRERRP